MFSPMVAIADEIASAIVIDAGLGGLDRLDVLAASSATSAIIFTRPWK
jgi:hypothetical protein